MYPYNRIERIQALDDLVAAGIQNHFLLLRLEGLADIGDRNGKHGIAYGNLHTVCDRHGKRDLKSCTASLAKLACDGNRTAY